MNGGQFSETGSRPSRAEIKSNQIKFIKQQRAWRFLQVAKTFNTHKTNKRYMHTLLISRDIAFLYIYLCIKTKTKGSMSLLQVAKT